MNDMNAMRRREKEITDRTEIDNVIHGCQVLHLAFALDNVPYIVPLSFGYDGRCLYFHCSKTGRKMDCLAANPSVCFQMERDVRIIAHPASACRWTFAFESIIGYGIAAEIAEADEKASALNRVIEHYGGPQQTFNDQALASVQVWRITITSLTGKRSRPAIAESE